MIDLYSARLLRRLRDKGPQRAHDFGERRVNRLRFAGLIAIVPGHVNARIRVTATGLVELEAFERVYPPSPARMVAVAVAVASSVLLAACTNPKDCAAMCAPNAVAIYQSTSQPQCICMPGCANRESGK